MPSDEERSLSVALARLEGKLDSLLSLHRRQSDDLDDHERRLRDVESTMHTLATREDIEAIELKRQKKTMTWAALIVSLVVPVEAALIALLIQSLNQ
jgi:hypothetical protein